MQSTKPKRKTQVQLMAAAMAQELERNRLEWIKEKTGSRLMYATSENPEWYRKLCAAHTSRRKDGYRWKKHKTSIKRRETLKALRYIAEGKKPSVSSGDTLRRPSYYQWLLQAVRAEIADDTARANFERTLFLESVPF
jgi:hypothetical protein